MSSPISVVISTTDVGDDARASSGTRDSGLGTRELVSGSSLRTPCMRLEKPDFPDAALCDEHACGAGVAIEWPHEEAASVAAVVSVVPMISLPFGSVIATRRPRVPDVPLSVDSYSLAADVLGSERKNSASRWIIETNFVRRQGAGETCRYGLVGLKSFV